MTTPSSRNKTPDPNHQHKTHLAWIAALFLALTSTAFATEQRFFNDTPGAYGGGSDEDEVASEGIGIGGTGFKPGERPGTETGDGNGIGGTGQQASGDGPSGIGGTGIIGAITGYGSIFVNGYEVEIPDEMAVTIKDGQTTADQLAIGQIVEIEASGVGGTDDTHVNAASVHIRHELGGTIERIDRVSRTITILGQKIQVNKTGNTPDGAPGSNGLAFENLKIGDRLDVSGFRRDDGTIDATRLDALPKQEADHLIAPIKKSDASGTTVGGIAIDTDPSFNQAAIEEGSEVRIVGHWHGRRFRARRIRPRARWRFSNRVRRLAIEGYARRAKNGDYVLGRYRLNRIARSALRQRTIYTGRFTGRFDARRRFILGNARAARLLTRRGRRIRALRRKIRRNATPEMRRKWKAMPPKAQRHRLRRQDRKLRQNQRRKRWRRNRN